MLSPAVIGSTHLGYHERLCSAINSMDDYVVGLITSFSAAISRSGGTID
jgi:hypothetical protein